MREAACMLLRQAHVYVAGDRKAAGAAARSSAGVWLQLRDRPALLYRRTIGRH